MKTTAFAVALSFASLLALQPAVAAPDFTDADQAAAGRIAYEPESPVAAFARMLAPRTPAAGTVQAPAQVDPLMPAFNLALWSKPAAQRHAAAARLHTVGALQ
ncbi:MAG TPA: hypothetical protein VK052_11210 [Zeimonas sp.]|nr:hypothetical protein [Zeimonas sp.]